MSDVISYGCSKVEVGDFNPTTGEVTNLVPIKVYKDTVDIQEADPEEEEHYSSGNDDAELVITRPGKTTARFSVMKSDADTLKLCLDGTVTTLEGRKTWNKPDKRSNKTKALVFTTEDGCVCTIPRGSWFGKQNANLAAGSIRLQDITVTPKATGIEGLASMAWTDPEPEV
ncbi:MAG: hypothetical protein ACO1NU_08720 [Arcticibacter sp.]